MNKLAQFSFTWIFAILAGGAILFLAIYGAMQFADTSGVTESTKSSVKLSILLNPLQAGFAEGSFGKIKFNQESRVNNYCLESNFGENRISISSRVGVVNEWTRNGEEIPIKDKYIFSSGLTSGTEFYVFSKRFDFPFKVSDLVFLTSEKYCFLDAPEEISEELLRMNMPNIEIDECENEGSLRVCFSGGSRCDVRIKNTCTNNCEYDFEEGIVEKYGVKMKYSGALMYAAIFSDKDIYECNVKRLFYRSGSLAEVFIEKSDLMDARNCNTNLKGSLILYKASVLNSSSANLNELNLVSKELGKKNSKEGCGLW